MTALVEAVCRQVEDPFVRCPLQVGAGPRRRRPSEQDNHGQSVHLVVPTGVPVRGQIEVSHDLQRSLDGATGWTAVAW